MKGTRPLRGQP